MTFHTDPIPFDIWNSEALIAGMDLSEKEKMQASYGSFVANMESFDALFFVISNVEAKNMDPQQRLLLECSYLAFKDSGYTMEDLRDMNCGIFVAVGAGGSTNQNNT